MKHTGTNLSISRWQHYRTGRPSRTVLTMRISSVILLIIIIIGMVWCWHVSLT